ncbi:MAG: hypothetical protein LUQ18_04975 [Methylococcaceae bacterium]|nr:hypothetical protein [Methylococcaceae bacterium]
MNISTTSNGLAPALLYPLDNLFWSVAQLFRLRQIIQVDGTLLVEALSVDLLLLLHFSTITSRQKSR